MRLIYIAGPYTAPTAAERMANVQRAREVADRVNRIGGCFAVTPHFLGDGIEDSGSAQFWYDATMEVMRRCDAVYLMPSWLLSVGARLERDEALNQRLPTFENFDALAAWVHA